MSPFLFVNYVYQGSRKLKVKHIEILECEESRTLFKILGRHRATRELNKGKLSCVPERRSNGKRTIMDNVHWSQSKNPAMWSILYRMHEQLNAPYGYTVRDKKYLRYKLLRGKL